MITDLKERILHRTARVGVIGLGYVGLPLVIEFGGAGFDVTGFDLDEKKVTSINAARSYIRHIPSASLRRLVRGGRFRATTDSAALGLMDCIIICVPTPVDDHRQPDLSFVIDTGRAIAQQLRRGQLVILESTTYPGTTEGELKDVLEKTGLKAGWDFHLAYSPEREDPNNARYTTRTIPKVIGGCTPRCLELAEALYGSVVEETVPVSSTRVAEATKLLENIYRAVNIALVNELKMLFQRMGIDIWEVIEASRTKPFGFQAFYPGPGLGGHCIPIDPFYLTWKAREYDFHTRFIELSGEINTAMPYYVVEQVARALDQRGLNLSASRVLVLGLAYKRDVDDIRESPALKLIELLRERGARVDYNDPYVPRTHRMRRHDLRMRSVSLTAESLAGYDCVLIATDHTCYDYPFITKHARLVVDTRHAVRNDETGKKVVRA